MGTTTGTGRRSISPRAHDIDGADHARATALGALHFFMQIAVRIFAGYFISVSPVMTRVLVPFRP
jgi:hypothetical protein